VLQGGNFNKLIDFGAVAKRNNQHIPTEQNWRLIISKFYLKAG